MGMQAGGGQAPDPMAGMMGAGLSGGNMRPGDWSCPACGDLQFARNAVCRRCATPRPAGGAGGACLGCGYQAPMATNPSVLAMGGQPGDWLCSNCGDLQFARNKLCRKCGSPPSAGGAGMGGGAMMGMGQMMGGGAAAGMSGDMRPGDWVCPQCSDLQFSRNVVCRKCGCGKPDTGAGQALVLPTGGFASMPGDWSCPQCNDLQFARNVVCRKCGAEKPAGATVNTAPMMSMGMPGVGGMQVPGDWSCPNCGDLQFARNVVCRLCATPKPDPNAAERARSRSPRRMQEKEVVEA